MKATRACAVLALALALCCATAPAAAQDCAARLQGAVEACHGDIKAVLAGGSEVAASASCCAAATGIFSGAFMGECGCDTGVLGIKAQATDGQIEALRSLTVAKCGGEGAAYPACPESRAAKAVSPRDAVPTTGSGSACTFTKCARRKICPSSRRYQRLLTKAQNNPKLGECDTAAGKPNGTNPLLIKANGTTACAPQIPNTNNTGIQFDAQNCFVTCTSIGDVPRTSGNGVRRNQNLCKNSDGGGGCFPGAATVTLASGAARALRDLKVGDVVAVAKPDGSVAFEDVVFFDHSMDGGANTFVRLDLGAAGALELSPGHFVPVGASLKAAKMARARDVKAGDIVHVAPAGALKAAPVAVEAVDAVTRAGFFAPVTLGGTVVVDGVVASSYSDWVLDPLFDFLGISDKLHAAYHAVHAPHRAIYRAAGAKVMAALSPIVSGICMLDARQMVAGLGLVSA